MTETKAGVLNKPNLIDELTEAVVDAELEYANPRDVAFAVLAVLRKRGLIDLQGLELIKREETK